ncbi:MAG: tetratricopeptide repeat protein [Treponema sp.]|nr:tetratricopeptide repeat protein [Treponema sp.]MCL2272362.1 tetratricopeptide repeat protein [Treponema sp.]
MKQTVILCVAVILSISCTQVPDGKTIRLYVRACETYAQGKFIETAGILQEEKKFPPSLLLRAKAEFFAGDLDTAEKTFHRTVKKQPSSFEAKLYLARILREKDDLSGAQKLTESLLADNPQDIRALRYAANLALEKGKNDEAIALLDRAAESSAESAMVLLDRARLHWTAGKAYKALEDLSRAKAMLPWETPLIGTISNLENTINNLLKAPLLPDTQDLPETFHSLETLNPEQDRESIR